MTTPQEPPGWSATPAYGPPPGYGPPPAYGPPPLPGSVPSPYGLWQPAPQTDGTAIVVLVLAICSFVVFPVVPAVVALVLAPGAERDIAASNGRLTGESLVRAGRIVAWVHLGLCAAFVVALLAFLGLFVAV